jgi:ADP-dependent NAD(P)H-hydrate dehydratase
MTPAQPSRSETSRTVAASASTIITPRLLREWRLREPDGARGKDGRGSVLVVGGSVQVPGGVMLSATAALRVGAGRLTIATARAVAPLVAVAIPEARVVGLPQNRSQELAPAGAPLLARAFAEHDAALVGPGMAAEGIPAARALLRAALAARDSRMLIVDAGALDALATLRVRPGDRSVPPIIATPHAQEMARFVGRPTASVLRRPLETAREVARDLGIYVVMKGETTYVVPPRGAALVNRAGSIGLGTSGSGDVLAGAITGFGARGASPLQAAVWGVYLHAKAGESLARRLGPLGFLASELPAELPSLLARLSIGS